MHKNNWDNSPTILALILKKAWGTGAIIQLEKHYLEETDPDLIPATDYSSPSPSRSDPLA